MNTFDLRFNWDLLKMPQFLFFSKATHSFNHPSIYPFYPFTTIFRLDLCKINLLLYTNLSGGYKIDSEGVNRD